MNIPSPLNLNFPCFSRLQAAGHPVAHEEATEAADDLPVEAEVNSPTVETCTEEAELSTFDRLQDTRTIDRFPHLTLEVIKHVA